MSRQSYLCQIRTPILRQTVARPHGTLSFTNWRTVRKVPAENTGEVAKWLGKPAGGLVQKRVIFGAKGRALYGECADTARH